MGSSSGPTSFKPDELAHKIRELENQAREEKFEIEVNNLISELLTYLNDRDATSIGRHLDEIKAALSKDIDGTIDLKYGGSVSKHTYVDGLSDIDALVEISKSELAQSSPEEVKEYFLAQLKNRFPNTEIKPGTLAVTLKFSDGIEIQLLPALKTATGYKIADETGKNWSSVVKPKVFTDQLIKVNQDCSGKVVPIIKLSKSIIADLPESQRLSGYHVEALAVEVFKEYTGKSNSLKAMLIHFFKNASEQVRIPIKDGTGQSTNLDDYLGEKGSSKRVSVANSLERISRRLENADGAQSVDMWREVIGTGN